MEETRVRAGVRLPGGWTRIELATELGVSRGSLYRWLKGVDPWPAPRLAAAAKALGVDESMLVPEG